MKSLSLTIQKIWPMLKFLQTETDRQTDRQTDGQAKNYMPPIYRYGGIKIGRWPVKSVSQIHGFHLWLGYNALAACFSVIFGGWPYGATIAAVL
jgi:hypothetical protein